jgi:hypothetical protein
MTFFTTPALAVCVGGLEKFGRFVGWLFLRAASTVVMDAAAQRVGMMWFVAVWCGRGWLNGIKIANVWCTFDMRNTVPRVFFLEHFRNSVPQHAEIPSQCTKSKKSVPKTTQFL